MSSTTACPKCGTEAPDDFGLVTCANCGFSFMVGLSGVDAAPAQQDHAVSEVAWEAPPVPEMPPADPLTEAFRGEGHREVENNVHSEVQSLPPVPVPSGEADFSDVVAFGNSPISKAADGLLLYDVQVSGLDSPELRADLKALLGESRLRLNSEDLLRTVKNGVLRIENISAVKAAYIVKELLPLPLEVTYRQKGIFNDVS